MSKVTAITSSSHFSSIVSSSTFVVVDFYADWCGPCKMIKPVFEQLAQSEAQPGKLTFVNVNVDNQREVAQSFGISAMPTFLVLKNGSVMETVKGANASALRSAVLSAASAAAKSQAKQSAAFSSKGQVLGAGAPTAQPATSPRSSASKASTSAAQVGRSMGLNPHTFANDVTRFVILYLTTLFSFDAAAAASTSSFSRTHA